MEAKAKTKFNRIRIFTKIMGAVGAGAGLILKRIVAVSLYPRPPFSLACSYNKNYSSE